MAIWKKITCCLPPAYWIPLIQFGVTLLLSMVAYGFSIQSAASIFVGGMICVSSNAVFIWRFFGRAESQSAREILKQAYQGVYSKLILTSLMFVVALKVFKELNILLLFVGFVSAQWVYWVAPFLLKRQILGKN